MTEVTPEEKLEMNGMMMLRRRETLVVGQMRREERIPIHLSMMMFQVDLDVYAGPNSEFSPQRDFG